MQGELYAGNLMLYDVLLG